MEYNNMVMLLLLLLSFDVFAPASAHHVFFLNEWVVQIYMNVSQFLCISLFLLYIGHS